MRRAGRRARLDRLVHTTAVTTPYAFATFSSADTISYQPVERAFLANLPVPNVAPHPPPLRACVRGERALSKCPPPPPALGPCRYSSYCPPSVAIGRDALEAQQLRF